MTIKKYQDADRNEIEVDDASTLLGPTPPPSTNSTRDPRFQLIQWGPEGKPVPAKKPVDPHSLETPTPPSKQGWGSGTPNAVDSPEFADILKKNHASRGMSVDSDEYAELLKKNSEGKGTV